MVPKQLLQSRHDGQTLAVTLGLPREGVTSECIFNYADLAWDYVTQRKEMEPHGVRMHVRAFPFWEGTAKPRWDKCEVRVGKLFHEPLSSTCKRFENMPTNTYKNWKEMLFALMVHELWHLFSLAPSGREQELECELLEAKAINEVGHQL